MANMLITSVGNSKIYFLFFLNVLATFSMTKQAEILVFGGNGFIGSECVETLLKDGHKVTVLNRGNSYYDYSTRIKPYVTEVQCDRDKGFSKCPFNSENPKTFDFVVDFSAFYPNVIEYALKYLKGHIGTYIYISSDSVYEVSKPSENRRAKETDAVRPEDPEERDELNKKDNYGHYKLAGEELLKETYSSFGIPYVVFRLPDVLGPRDRTYRWWTYQAWMQVYGSSGKPLPIPRSTAGLTTSYVYVKDVARMISKTVSEIHGGNQSSYHLETFNIAFPEEYSLKKLLNSMQGALEVKGIEYRYEDNAYHLFPSVSRGSVDISKAVETLQFTATPWNEAIQETVAFFKDALPRFKNERYSMILALSNLVDEDVDTVEQKVKRYLKTQGKSKKRDSKSENHVEL